MSQTRGAAAPTSGQQDHVELNTQALDQAINDVAKNAQAWAATSPVQRAEFLARIISDTYAVSEEWTAFAWHKHFANQCSTSIPRVAPSTQDQFVTSRATELLFRSFQETSLTKFSTAA